MTDELDHDPNLEPEDDEENELDHDHEELSAEEAEERFLVMLNSATEITAAAVSNSGAQALNNPDQVAALFTKVFDAIVNL